MYTKTKLIVSIFYLFSNFARCSIQFLRNKSVIAVSSFITSNNDLKRTSEEVCLPIAQNFIVFILF